MEIPIHSLEAFIMLRLDPAIIYRDLESDPAIFGHIIADRHLATDQFVSTHRETIRRHYAKAGGYALDHDDARQAALVLFQYLRPVPYRFDAQRHAQH